MRGKHEKHDEPNRNPMRKILYLIGALVCLVGLFYFILMLTRDLAA